MKKFTLDELQKQIVPFIEAEYPEGERGKIVIAIVLFTQWLRDNVK